jgi:hypothetical protein
VNGGVTQSGVTLGTFDYIAPEQALDPRAADARSDFYSLGCTFYHAVTGVTPVPEGTAARKLHAHQHEAPLDPRDWNAAVPDALAEALAAMMAKDPARRPQTADDLLLLLKSAQEECVRGGSIAKKQTLSSDAKWALAFLATIAAAVLAMMLSSKWTPNAPAPKPAWMESASPFRGVPESTAMPAAPPADTAMKMILTAADFAAACRTNEPLRLRLQPGTLYDLASLSEGIQFTGPSFTVESETGSGPPPVLRVASTSADERAAGSLSFRGCREVKLQGVAIVLATSNAERAMMASAGALTFEQVESVVIDGCRVQADLDTRDDQVAAVFAHPRTMIAATHTIFNLGAQNTVFAVADGSTISMEECAVTPHRAVVELRTAGSEALTTIHFKNTTVLLDRNGTLVRGTPANSPTATLAACLIAALEPAASFSETGAVPVKWSGTTANGVFQVPPPTDLNARTLARAPWGENDIRKLLESGDVAAAFRMNLNDPRLRLPAATGAVVLGVKALGSPESRIYSGAWPPEKPVVLKPAADERIVWPEVDADDATPRVHATFAEAFAALQVGETLTLAVNGVVNVPPLPEKTLKATIRAAAGFKPLLVPEGAVSTADAPMFRLGEGELNFDGVAIRLTNRQSVVTLASGTSCSFRNCVITIQEKDELPAVVVVIPDTAREMRASAGDGPRVRFEQCLIRGDGRLVWAHSARTFDLAIQQCAIMLDGSAVRQDASSKAVTGDSVKTSIRLNRVTSVLTGPWLELKAGRSGGIVNVDAEECLFAAADARGSSVPFILMDGIDTTTDPSQLLSWSGRGSVYAYHDAAASVEWRGVAAPRQWDWPQWLRYARDEGRHIARVRFAKGSLKTKLVSVIPDDLELATVTMLDAGADVKKLPTPAP